ncbi:uncharacterized protein [Venturia canescens]|uniref:uncharacterized protein n=1 Tax=Venturia canescens TaxID=32260 RepID=UPI001C9C9BA8|nr:uncharacterized protein LOC122411908 [Venturia canescens]
MGEIATRETEWIEETLVPKIAQRFGLKAENVRCSISFPENCFFISYVCFVDLEFDKSIKTVGRNSEKQLKLVIKKLPLNPLLVKELKLVKQFHNEILFYTKFASGNPRFPRCIHTDNDTTEDSVIVTENLSTQGFSICPQTHNIPTEYIFSAVKEIGKLHAIAYVMKERESERFYNIVSAIQEPRLNPDAEWFDKYVNIIATRPIDWLRRNNYDKEFCNKLEKHLGNGFEEIMLYAKRPVEPIATLCHGDFTRNNIFFRNINGKLESKLFDFALITYSSPAIDLSTFLYLNCSADDRIGKFNEIYRAYHDTVMEHLRDSGIKDLDKYSHDKMLADYKRRAAFGYMIASFFMPVMLGFINVDFETIFRDPLAQVPEVMKAGGEFMTEIFAQMILELKALGSFDHVI